MANDLAALKAQLDAINGPALQAAERVALRQVGVLIRDAVIERAPVRTEYDGGDLQPGDLKRKITARVHIATDTSVLSGDSSRVTIAPTADVAYIARFVEDGHVNRPGSKTANTPAHPFVRPAFDETQQAAIDLYTQVMTDAITAALSGAPTPE
jgi:HK97 gp10 family phage protein